MIKIIGTAHVLEKSVRDVKSIIEKERPDIIALELDEDRFKLLEEMKWNPQFYATPDFDMSLHNFGGGGSFLVLLSKFLSLIQQEIGRVFGRAPGSEMGAAVKCASKYGARIALIDRDLMITLNHLLNIPFREKIGMFLRSNEDLEIIGSVLGANPERVVEKRVINRILLDLRTNLPNLYSALIDERDRYMAYLLYKLQKRNPDVLILAVVGAGHKQGISYYLKRLSTEKNFDMESDNTMYPISNFSLLFFVFATLFLYLILKIRGFENA